jgi:hypothetical protein
MRSQSKFAQRSCDYPYFQQGQATLTSLFCAD